MLPRERSSVPCVLCILRIEPRQLPVDFGTFGVAIHLAVSDTPRFHVRRHNLTPRSLLAESLQYAPALHTTAAVPLFFQPDLSLFTFIPAFTLHFRAARLIRFGIPRGWSSL